MNSESIESRKKIVFHFQVHVPKMLRIFQYLDIGKQQGFFDDDLNEMIVKSISQDCYLPINKMLLNLIKSNPNLKICFSINGETLELFEKHSPETLQSFQDLASSGAVELFGETHFHSLASLLSKEEFQAQVISHSESLLKYFGVCPTVFGNTELIYNDDIGSTIAAMGFNGVITEGADHVVSDADRNNIFKHPEGNINLLLRDIALSESISVRFGAGDTRLTVDKFLTTLTESTTVKDSVTLIGFDYAIFGERQNRESGMVDFIEALLTRLANDNDYALQTASEAIASYAAVQPLSVKETVSSSREQRNIATWLGNDMQQEAFEILRLQSDRLHKVADEEVISTWRSLQSSDHFYYMSTQKHKVGHYPDQFTPYPSPYEAFINYMSALNDFALNLQMTPLKESDDQHAKNIESERPHPREPVWAMQIESQQRKAPEIRV